jgi:hypothetical protein
MTTSLDVNHTITAPVVCLRFTRNDSDYKTISATSMASPHVVGGRPRLCIAGGYQDKVIERVGRAGRKSPDALPPPGSYSFFQLS